MMHEDGENDTQLPENAVVAIELVERSVGLLPIFLVPKVLVPKTPQNETFDLAITSYGVAGHSISI